MRLFFYILCFYVNISVANTIVGKAYVDNKLVYIEKHYPTVADTGLYKSLQTEYFDETRTKFAMIKSDFTKDKYVPDSFFEDLRFNSTEEVIFDPNSTTITVKNTKKSKKDIQNFKINKNAVAGQGFHNYIVNHFSELLQSKRKISIVVANKKDYYNFIIEKKKHESDIVMFEISPENFFLKQLVTPIELEYSIAQKKLIRFYGLSNLDNSNGKSQIVNIKYEYTN